MEHKIIANGNFDNICDSQAYKEVKEYINYLTSEQRLTINDIKITLYGTTKNPKYNYYRKKGFFSNLLGKSKVKGNAPKGYEKYDYVISPMGSVQLKDFDYTTHLNAAKSSNPSFGDCHEVYFAVSFNLTDQTPNDLKSYYERYRRKKSIRIYITTSIAAQGLSNLAHYKDLEGNKLSNGNVIVYISIDEPTQNLLLYPLIDKDVA